MAKTKKKAAKKHKVLIHTPLLTFVETKDHLDLVPTSDGIEEAREMLEARQSGRWRGILSELSDFLEYAMGNGWDYVPPEDIGALTDGTIISQDGFIGDDGHWYPHPSVKRAKVYWHANYMVEDPIETWANGQAVRLFKREMSLTAQGREAAIRAWEGATGETYERENPVTFADRRRAVGEAIRNAARTGRSTFHGTYYPVTVQYQDGVFDLFTVAGDHLGAAYNERDAVDELLNHV